MTNLLSALKNVFEHAPNELGNLNTGTNRANNMGDALELYIQDIFSDAVGIAELGAKDAAHQRAFSYLGNTKNPPDIILREGDAIEVKKIETPGKDLALNSSYPKDKLHSNSPMITTACRGCEAWEAKDIIYVVGLVTENRLKSLWFVYGDCYAANSEVYERVASRISAGLNDLPDVELAETNELGRVNKVDPLGITNLRIRGMWTIKNPLRVFDTIRAVNNTALISVNAVMLRTKYESFPEADRISLEDLRADGVVIEDAEIRSPNNPAQLLPVKVIKFLK